MGQRIYRPRLAWGPLPQEQGGARSTARLAQALRDWERTPYESGARFRGRGADCIGAVFGVVDDLDGQARACAPGMPRDAAMHDRAGAVRAVRELVRRYSPCHKIAAEPGGMFQVEPGDVVVTGAPGGGPGHVEIVGSRPGELWHAIPGPGFHQGGWSLLQEQVLYAIYRIEDKWRWAVC